MAGWITAIVGSLALVVGWFMYRRFSRNQEELRHARRKKRGPATQGGVKKEVQESGPESGGTSPDGD